MERVIRLSYRDSSYFNDKDTYLFYDDSKYFESKVHFSKGHWWTDESLNYKATTVMCIVITSNIHERG